MTPSEMEIAFQHIFNVILRLQAGVCGRSIRYSPTEPPLCCSMGGRPPSSVTVPPLVSDSKSVLNQVLHLLYPVTRPIATVPLFSVPPVGNPRICRAKRVLYSSRNPSKGEKSEISLFSTFSHFKLVKPRKRGYDLICRFPQDSDELTRLTLPKRRYIRLFHCLKDKIQFFQTG